MNNPRINLSVTRPPTTLHGKQTLLKTPAQRPLPIAVHRCKKTVPRAVITQVVAPSLSAAMQRILFLYRTGNYCPDTYSVRTRQRHRKLFLTFGIDLRVILRANTMRPTTAKPLTNKLSSHIKPKTARKLVCIKSLNDKKVGQHHE